MSRLGTSLLSMTAETASDLASSTKEDASDRISEGYRGVGREESIDLRVA